MTDATEPTTVVDELAAPIREATVIKPGDHLIVLVEGAITAEQADQIKRRLMDRMPLLADVTVVRANGLAVFRDDGGVTHHG